MTTSTITSRLASFSAAFAVTMALLVGVSSMAVTEPAPAWIAKAAVVQNA
jgi:hypothetical protein